MIPIIILNGGASRSVLPERVLDAGGAEAGVCCRLLMNGFSATGLGVVLPSMEADVVDYDELQSGQRRESAYTATASWVMKVGMMFSRVIGGPLLEATGFDSKLPTRGPDAILGIRVLFVGLPVIALSIALVLVKLHPLSAARMREIRRELEARRSTV